MYLVCVYVLILGVTNNVVISQKIPFPIEGIDLGPSVQEIVWELGKFIKEYIQIHCNKPIYPVPWVNTEKNDEHPVYVKVLSDEPEEETLVIRRNYADRLGPRNDLIEPAFRRSSALNESDIEEEPLSDEEKDSILLEIEDQPKDSKSVLTAEELILNINGPEGMRRSSVTLPKDLQSLISTYLKQRKRRQRKRIKVSISENSRISVTSGNKNVQYRRADDTGEGDDVLVEEVSDQNPVFEDDEEVVRRFILVPKDEAQHVNYRKKFLPDLGTLLTDKVNKIISKPIQKLMHTKNLPFKPVQYQYAPDKIKGFTFPYGSPQLSLENKPPPVKYYAQDYGIQGQNPPGQVANPYGSKQPNVQYNVPYSSIKLSTDNQPYNPQFQIPGQFNKPYGPFKLSTDSKQPDVQYNGHKYEIPGHVNKPYSSIKLSLEKQPYTPTVQYNAHKFEIPVQSTYPYGSVQLSTVGQPYGPGVINMYPGQVYNPYDSFRLPTEYKPDDPKVQYKVYQYDKPRQSTSGRINPYGSLELSVDRSKQPFSPDTHNVYKYEITGEKKLNPTKINLAQFNTKPETFKYHLPAEGFLNVQQQPVQFGLNQQPIQIGYTQYKPADISPPNSNQYSYNYQIAPARVVSKTNYPDQAYPAEYPYYIYTKHPKPHTHKHGHKKLLIPTAEYGKPPEGLYSKILSDKILHKQPKVYTMKTKHTDKHYGKKQKFFNIPQYEQEDADEEYALRRLNGPNPTIINQNQPPVESMLENVSGNLTDEARQKLLASVMSKIAEEFENDVQPPPVEEDERQEVFRRAMTQIAEEFDKDMAEHPYMQPLALEKTEIQGQEGQEVFHRAMTQIAEEFDKDVTEQDVQPPPLENPPIEDQRQEVFRRAMTQIAEEFDKDMIPPPLENPQIEEDKQLVLNKAMTQIAQEFDKDKLRSDGQTHPKKDIEEVYTRAMSEIEKEFGKQMAINKPEQLSKTKQPTVVRTESADSDKKSLKSSEEEGFIYGKSVESTDQNSPNENDESSDSNQQSCESENEETSAQTPENQGNRRNCTETQVDTNRNYQPSSTSEEPKSAVQWGMNLIKGMFDGDNATQMEQAKEEEEEEEESSGPGKLKQQITEINMTEVRRFNKRPDTFTSSVGIEDFHQSDSSSNESSNSSELLGNELAKKNEASNGGSIMSVIGNLFPPAEVDRTSNKGGDGIDADNVTMYYSQVTYNQEKDKKSFPKPDSAQNMNEPSRLDEGMNEKWEDNESISISPVETVAGNLETGDIVSQNTMPEEVVDLRHGIHKEHDDIDDLHTLEPSEHADSTPSTSEVIDETATESVDTVTFLDIPTPVFNEEIQTIADMGEDLDYNLYYGTEDPGSYITERTTTVSTSAETTLTNEGDTNLDYDQGNMKILEDPASDREDTTTLDEQYDTGTDEELFYGNKEYQEQNTVVPQRRNRGKQSEEIIEDIESDPLYQKGIIFLKHKLMFEPYTQNGKYENYITKKILEKPYGKLNDTEKLIFHRLVWLAQHPDDLISKYSPNEYSPSNSTDNKFFLRGSLYDSLLDNDYLRKGVVLLKNYPFKRKLEYSKSSPELKRLLWDFGREKKYPTSEEKRINQVLHLLASNPDELEKVYNAIVQLHGEPDKNELEMTEKWAQRLQNETGFMYTDHFNKGLELMYLHLNDHQNNNKPENDFRKFLIKLLFKKDPNEVLNEEEQRILDSLIFIYKNILKKPLDKEEQEMADDNLYKIGIIILYNSPNRDNLRLMGNELLESVMKKPDTELNSKEYKIYNKLMSLAKNPEELQKRYYDVTSSVNGEIENDTNNTISQGVQFLKQYYQSNEGKQPTSPEEISTLLAENVLKKRPEEFTKRDQYVYDILMYISQNMQLLDDFGNIEQHMVHNHILYKTGIITIYNSPNRNNSEVLAEEILQTVIKKPKTDLNFIERKVYESLMNVAKHPEILTETYDNIMNDAKDITDRLAEDAEGEDKEEKNKYMIAIIKIPNKPQDKNGDVITNKTIKVVVDDLHRKITDMSGEPVSCEKMVFLMPEEHSKPLEPMNIDEETNLVHQLEYVRTQIKVNHALPGVFKEEEISERLDNIILYLIRMLQSGFSSSTTENDQIVYDLNVIESGEDSHELLGRIILLIKKRKTKRKEIDDGELVEHLTTLQRQLIKKIKSYYGTTDFKQKPVGIERQSLSEHNVDEVEKDQAETENRVAFNQPGEENEDAELFEKAQRRSFFSEDQNYQQDIPRGQRIGLMDTPIQMAMNVIGKWFAAQNTMQPPPDAWRRFVQDQQQDVYTQKQKYQQDIPRGQRRGLMDTPIQMAMNVVGNWFAGQNTMQPANSYRRFVEEDTSHSSSETAEDNESMESGEYFKNDNYEEDTETGKEPNLKQAMEDTPITRIIPLTNTDGQQNEHEIRIEGTRNTGLENAGEDLEQQEEQTNMQKMEDTPIIRTTGLKNTFRELKQQNEEKYKKMRERPIIQIPELENIGKPKIIPVKDMPTVMNREWTIKSIKPTRHRQRRLKKRQSEETVKVTDDTDNDNSIQLKTMRRGFSPRFMKRLEEMLQERKSKMQQVEDEENPVNIKQPSRRMFPLNILSSITNFLPIGGQGGLGNPLQMLGQLNPMQFLGAGMRRGDIKPQEEENKYAVPQDSSVPAQYNIRQMPEMNQRQDYNEEIQKYVYYPRLEQTNQQPQQDLGETTQQNDPLGTPPHPEGDTSTTELSSKDIYSTSN